MLTGVEDNGKGIKDANIFPQKHESGSTVGTDIIIGDGFGLHTRFTVSTLKSPCRKFGPSVERAKCVLTLFRISL